MVGTKQSNNDILCLEAYLSEMHRLMEEEPITKTELDCLKRDAMTNFLPWTPFRVISWNLEDLYTSERYEQFENRDAVSKKWMDKRLDLIYMRMIPKVEPRYNGGVWHRKAYHECVGGSDESWVLWNLWVHERSWYTQWCAENNVRERVANDASKRGGYMMEEGYVSDLLGCRWAGDDESDDDHDDEDSCDGEGKETWVGDADNSNKGVSDDLGVGGANGAEKGRKPKGKGQDLVMHATSFDYFVKVCGEARSGDDKTAKLALKFLSKRVMQIAMARNKEVGAGSARKDMESSEKRLAVKKKKRKRERMQSYVPSGLL